MAIMALALSVGTTPLPGASLGRISSQNVLGNLPVSRDSYKDIAAASFRAHKKDYIVKVYDLRVPSSSVVRAGGFLVVTCSSSWSGRGDARYIKWMIGPPIA